MVRLVPINKFYKLKLMPMVERAVRYHLRRAGKMNEFEDACAYVFLSMIPMLRRFQPTKSDRSAHYDGFLLTCIKYRLIRYLKMQNKGNWSEQEMKTLFDFVSFEALPEFRLSKDSLDDPPALRKEKGFNRYEDYEYHVYLWDKLLPKLIGPFRTNLLFYQYVKLFTHLQIALRYGHTDNNWSNKLNQESITMLKMMADDDPKVRTEFLR